MLSKRSYAVIVLMMMVLLFMFQFSQIIKDNGNEYETNKYSKYDMLDSSTQWTSKGVNTGALKHTNGYVMFWGKADSLYADTVLQWCNYTKRDVIFADMQAALPDSTQKYPEILLIDPDGGEIEKQLWKLGELADAGCHIIFLRTPDYEILEQSEELRRILGITDLVEKNSSILGVHLFDGFFVGGEVVYRLNEKDEKAGSSFQDFDLTIPWYITGKGTKTYMVGLKDEDEAKPEKFPRILWRSRYENSFVFAVNGDFCESLAGLGILDAFLYEATDYTLYPVINAQSLSLLDCPTLSSENQEEMKAVYGRDTREFYRDILWPGILAMTMQNDLIPTCYMQSRYDYSLEQQEEGDQLVFYLQQMKEINAEAGRSLRFNGNTTLADKVRSDEVFYQGSSYYYYSTYYTDSLSGELRKLVEAEDGMQGIHSITCRDRGDLPLVSYYTDNVVLLGTTGDVENYSFREDFYQRSLNTALGYTNLLMDFHPVLWPNEQENQWQHFSDRVISNISTYFSGLLIYDRTTVSDSDYRIRLFLNQVGRVNREENRITLDTGTDFEGYYLLRTHGERIVSIENGEYREMEKDTYLLHTKGRQVQIKLEKTSDILEYDGPFRLFGR